jgi:hypothetical protein
VVDEKAAAIIDQQLVEFRVNRIVDAEASGYASKDILQDIRPMPPAQMYPVSADLPAAPNCGIDNRLLPTPERGRLGDRDDLLGLHRQEGKRYRAYLLHLQDRREQRGRSGDEEVSRTLNLREQ